MLLVFGSCYYNLLSSFELFPRVTLTCEHDLDRVKVNQHAKYLGHLVLKLLPKNTDRYITHTGPITLLGPLKW